MNFRGTAQSKDCRFPPDRYPYWARTFRAPFFAAVTG